MKKARTDASLSSASAEFEWSAEGLTEENTYILPPVLDWLRRSAIKTLLDLGCGNGGVSQELASAGFQVTGLDNSASGLRIAQKSYPAIRFVQQDLAQPLPEDMRHAFDAVISLEVIEHLFLPRHLLQRAQEALAPGGLFILSTPFHGYWKNICLALLNQWDAHWHPLRDYGHIKFFSISTLGQLLAEESFAVETITRVGRIAPLAKSMVLRCRTRS